MAALSHAYLVEETKTKKRRLVAASAPANAIAFCAKEAFTAQRVEGAVLDTLTASMTVEHVTPPKPEGGEATDGDDDNKDGGGDNGDGGTAQGAKGGSGTSTSGAAPKGKASGEGDKPGE